MRYLRFAHVLDYCARYKCFDWLIDWLIHWLTDWLIGTGRHLGAADLLQVCAAIQNVPGRPRGRFQSKKLKTYFFRSGLYLIFIKWPGSWNVKNSQMVRWILFSQYGRRGETCVINVVRSWTVAPTAADMACPQVRQKDRSPRIQAGGLSCKTPPPTFWHTVLQ